MTRLNTLTLKRVYRSLIGVKRHQNAIKNAVFHAVFIAGSFDFVY